MTMANNYIPLSGAAISASQMNALKNESNTGSVSNSQPDSSIRGLHDWFWSNAHITHSDATAAGQTDVKFSEFYKAQVLEATYIGRDESGDGWYGHTNNAYVQVSVNPDCLVRDGSDDYAVNWLAYHGGGNHSAPNNDSDKVPHGNWNTSVNNASIGTVWGPGDVQGTSGYHQSGYNFINVYIQDFNTGAWLMRQVQIDDSSSAHNSSSNKHTDLTNYQVTDTNPAHQLTGETGYKGVSGGSLNPPGWALGTDAGQA